MVVSSISSQIEKTSLFGERKEKRDLFVLQAMAKRVAGTLLTLEQEESTQGPASYHLQERRGKQHRILIFAAQELLHTRDMRFVGFVSQKSQQAEASIVEAIGQADEALLKEINHIPGLLSYSSLEMQPGHWYNLVLFRDSGVKAHIKRGQAHQHAAHVLSPAYYEWIRLHNGSLHNGIIGHELHLHSTKYYQFAGPHQPPTVHIQHYEPCNGAC